MFLLRVIFYGLVAFVPNPNDSSMYVVFPNARGGQWASDGCEISEHLPALLVAADSCRRETTHCGFSQVFDEQFGLPSRELGILGSWLLESQEVKITLGEENALGEIQESSDLKADLKGALTYTLGRRESGASMPANAFQAADFSWVPNPNLGSTVERRCLSGKGCSVAARIHIVGKGKVATCHLVETREDVPRVCPFQFSPLPANSSSARPLEPQAIADAVMVTFEIPKNKMVILTVTTLDDKEPSKIYLTAEKRPTVDVWMVNLPIGGYGEDYCHNHDLDRHFELYYNLSKRQNNIPIPLAGRPIPQRLEQNCASSANVQPVEPEKCPIITREKKKGTGPVPGDKPACGTRAFLY